MVSRRTAPLFVALTACAGILLMGAAARPVAPTAERVQPAAGDALASARHARAGLFLGDYLHSGAAPAALSHATSAWLLTGATFWTGRRPADLPSSIAMAAERDTAGAGAGVALLRRARTHVERGESAKAVAVYDSAAHLLPQLRDWIDVFTASAAASAGDTSRVRQWHERADPALQEWAWRVPARAARQAGDRRLAIAKAEDAALSLETPARRASAWLLAGQFRAERQDYAGARLSWIRAINTAEGSAPALEAARSLVALPGVTATDHLIAGRVFMRHRNTARGVASLRIYAAWDGADAYTRERVLYDIGEAALRDGDFARAETELRKLAESAADRRVAADAWFAAARAMFRSGRSSEALRVLRTVVEQYPDIEASARAAFLAADLLHDAGDIAQSSYYYDISIRRAPASTDAAAARMRLGAAAFADARYDEALQQFEALREQHTTGRTAQQAAFWAGMASARAGMYDRAALHFTDARDSDPFSYYGGLAAEELGDDGWHGRIDHSPPTSELHDRLARGALARIDLLRAAGWDDAASFETERSRRYLARIDGALYAFAESLHARGAISAGVSMAWEIYRQEGAWNLRLLRIVYPFPFKDLILAHAEARGVDPFLAAALIRQESMFNPGARSPVGAAGLMQVMPATARSMARRVNVARFTPDLLVQPDINVAFGTTYLADQLNAYGDRLDLVLAAYNAGPGRVARWRSFPEYTDRLLFAERIPFEETRDYVRVVQNNRRLYAALYGRASGLVPAE